MNGIALTDVLINLGATAVGIVLLMLGTMSYALKTNNQSIIDTIWGIGFAFTAVVSFLVSLAIDPDGNMARRVIVTVLVVVWGVRLGTYIHRRNHVRYGAAGDPRYIALMKKVQGPVIPFIIRRIYLPQGVIMWIVSMPVQVSMYESAALDVFTWIGVALWVIGFTFEAVGDAQLAKFKADPANSGKVMDKGLWGWTRHPNYFGDSCLWFGLWIIACSHWIGALTVFAPILMTFFLVARSGKALLERRMARQKGPAYEAYLANTSGFFPMPPKKRVDAP